MSSDLEGSHEQCEVGRKDPYNSSKPMWQRCPCAIHGCPFYLISSVTPPLTALPHRWNMISEKPSPRDHPVGRHQRQLSHLIPLTINQCFIYLRCCLRPPLIIFLIYFYSLICVSFLSDCVYYLGYHPAEAEFWVKRNLILDQKGLMYSYGYLHTHYWKPFLWYSYLHYSWM